MAKITLPKEPHSMVINFSQRQEDLIQIRANKLTPREITELEVIHISVKTHISR